MYLNYKEFLYNSYILSKLINSCLTNGTQNLIESQLYFLLKLLKFKNKFSNSVFIIFECFEILKPTINFTTSLKKINSKLNVPANINYNLIPLTKKKSYNLTLKWFKNAINLNRNFSFYKKVYNEIFYTLFLKKSSITLEKQQQHYYLIITNRYNKRYRF